jgi:hypothetical protein
MGLCLSKNKKTTLLKTKKINKDTEDSGLKLVKLNEQKINEQQTNYLLNKKNQFVMQPQPIMNFKIQHKQPRRPMPPKPPKSFQMPEQSNQKNNNVFTPFPNNTPYPNFQNFNPAQSINMQNYNQPNQMPMMPFMSTFKATPTKVENEPESNKNENGIFERFFLFGQNRHEESFIYEIDSETNEFNKFEFNKLEDFEKKSIKILNYSGCIIKDKETMIVCGGINVKLTSISRTCFEFNFVTNKIKKLEDMVNIRYTFPVIFHKGKIFAFGGRQFGDDTT